MAQIHYQKLSQSNELGHISQGIRINTAPSDFMLLKSIAI